MSLDGSSTAQRPPNRPLANGQDIRHCSTCANAGTGSRLRLAGVLQIVYPHPQPKPAQRVHPEAIADSLHKMLPSDDDLETLSSSCSWRFLLLSSLHWPLHTSFPAQAPPAGLAACCAACACAGGYCPVGSVGCCCADVMMNLYSAIETCKSPLTCEPTVVCVTPPAQARLALVVHQQTARDACLSTGASLCRPYRMLRHGIGSRYCLQSGGSLQAAQVVNP